MKKSLLFMIVLIPAFLWSQEPAPKSWVWTGITGLNLNQASFSNWTAGGVNSVAFSVLGKFSANHTKDKFTWNNNLNLMYGMVKNQNETLKKSEDIIELISVAGYDISKSWSITGYMSFRSQFADGFDKDNDSIIISRFMSPGYLTLSPGFRFKPNDYFYLILSPATAKFTFVTDQVLADQGSFGVTPAKYETIDSINVKVKDGENVLVYLGPFLEAYFKKDVAKGLTYESRLNILYSFLNRDIKGSELEPYDADVSWENFLNYSIAKYFSISVFLHFVYLPGQPTIKFDNYEGAVRITAVPNRHIQIKETLGIGITYSFPEGK
jgi:hypothetical protein